MMKLLIFSIHEMQMLYILNCLAVDVCHIVFIKLLCFPECSV